MLSLAHTQVLEDAVEMRQELLALIDRHPDTGTGIPLDVIAGMKNDMATVLRQQVATPLSHSRSLAHSLTCALSLPLCKSVLICFSLALSHTLSHSLS
jgi:hypothetical protein